MCMCINHKFGHCQIKKLVVYAAINQVVQNLLGRLMRVDGPRLALIATSPPPLYRGSPSAAVPIEFVLAAALRSAAPHPPVAAFSTHLATPRKYTTSMQSSDDLSQDTT